MNRIDKCIARGMHVTDNLKFSGKVWQDFENACKGKNLILYGIGNLIIFLELRCKYEVKIMAAVDNDSAKQGHLLSDFIDESDLQESKNIKIESSEILQKYNPEDTVVLISSQRYYDEIAMELETRKFYCYFSILHLEYNYREYMKQNNLIYDTEDTFLKNYAKYCSDTYPVQNNKIVFYTGNYNMDHGKYITEQLLLLNKKLEIIWILANDVADVPDGVRIVLTRKLKQCIYEMETAKIWLCSVQMPTHIIKRIGQKYIQMKHWGSITLKKFYLSDKSNANPQDVKADGKLMDYIISGSEFDENSCREGFNFSGSFLRFGSPRSDALFMSDKYKNKICKFYNLRLDDHILIYAPTFRMPNNNAEKNFADFKWQNLDFELLIKSLQLKWQYNWVIFLRLHPRVRNRSQQIKLPSYVIDVSNYYDNQELVAASDVMISDYSSIIFEPAYIQKPVFLYAPDKDDYIRNERELLISYDSLPFPISTTNEELVEQIKNFDEKKYKQDVQTFLNKYGVHEDGHASQRAAQFILKYLHP